MPFITASKLYDYTQCPHRVWRDVYGPQEEKIIETNPFVQMLWDRGVQHEKDVIKGLGEILDLSHGSYEERAKKTLEVLNNKIPLIYQGVLRHENLMGIPDLLRLEPDGTYIPIEIKSGMGFAGADEESGEGGKMKKHYAVQLALYVELLERLGFEHKNKGIILDIHKEEAFYNLNELLNKIEKTTVWDYYQKVKNNVGLLLKNESQNLPAYSGQCKLCPWYASCKKWVLENNDLTGLFYVGRSKRDIINQELGVYKIEDVLTIDLKYIEEKKKKDKKFLKGVGADTLIKIIKRANILINIKAPVAYDKIGLPKTSHELFFDIEDDPTQEFVYLHGVYERGPKGERFIDFTAEDNSPKGEKKAWSNFWKYIKTLPENDYSVYYYSPHEKTTYKKLQKQYPDVISAEEVVQFFERENTIDLYHVVLKHTDWPLPSYSIKELAVYLGFKWRDKTPSGALSIQWYNDYLETKDEKILERIKLYNEDDCKATMVLKDALVKL
ncbi:MAG: TM0106 family RecB-like putative nuclease [Patescibacteria group bacterium]|nr:TM0106 family RecB-like putative nuclease [Patescibacteria group bacterium]MDD4610475.1 TM0106 family RecB-like putative nuclease [Patescibacteria group bacterium]